MAPLLGRISDKFGLGYTSSDSGGFSASGGTEVTNGGFKYHVFTTSGALEVGSDQSTEAEVLIVAGGASGGGYYYAGGGGAGGVVHSSSVTITTGTYPVDIGSGGANTGAGPGTKNPGADSSFGTVTAIGGGAGGSHSTNGFGDAGGSSGGNSGYKTTTPTAKTPQPVPGDYTAYGNSGGTGGGYGGGGGGGAGGVGSNAPGSLGAPGGAGQPFPGFPAPVIAPAIPAPVRTAWTSAVGPTGLFGGGGGGANYYTTSGRSTGGPGGGGRGQGTYPGNLSEPGIDYTGGGGGGDNYEPGNNGGGDGIVIVKYAT